ncbi:MAG TPA: Clp protease ClpP, partial [Ruminococcus sp.]|nr:Clp protease ClpP [Ruminococcus sp.]
SKIARMMDEETWLNAKKAQSLGLVDGILFASGQPQTKQDEDDKPDEDTPDEDEPKKDNLAAMSYSRAATMQSLMQKVSAEHKGTPVDQLMSRLNLLKY